MKLLFWNTNRNKAINKHIASIVSEFGINIIILAEYEADYKDLLRRLEFLGEHFEKNYTVGCERIVLLSSSVKIQPAVQDKYYSIHIIEDKYVLAGLHLMSDLYGNHYDKRLVKIQSAMHDIHDAERIVGSRRTIIIGDMNESPYDRGCLSAHGFHGLPDLKAEDVKMRTVDGIEYTKYYNPTWNLLGNRHYPPGTYYKNRAELYTPMWYMIDQVIIGQDLIDTFNLEEYRIITEYSNTKLYDNNKHPDRSVSDHFPIMCEVNDNKEMATYGE